MNAVYRKKLGGPSQPPPSVAASPTSSTSSGAAAPAAGAAAAFAAPSSSADHGLLCARCEIPASATAWPTLVKAAKAAHSAGGTMLASDFNRGCSQSFTDKDAEKFLGVSSSYHIEGTIKYKILRRGHFSCNVPNCRFAVPFTFHTTPKANPRYEIKGVSGREKDQIVLCLEHNHPPTAEAVASVNGKVFVIKEKDLMDEEVEELVGYATRFVNMPTIRLGLRQKFPGREIDNGVIKQVIGKERDRVFGKDRHRLVDLQKRGEMIRKDGGTFKEKISSSTYRLGSLTVQTETMRRYADQYGTYFSLMDGSHKMNLYSLQTIPVTGIDALGWSCFVGFGCGISEKISNCTAKESNKPRSWFSSNRSRSRLERFKARVELIWEDDVDFRGGCTRRHYFDIHVVLCILALKYQRTFVVYQRGKGKSMSIAQYLNEKGGSVSYYMYRGEWRSPPEGSVCIVHDGKMHYEYLQLKPSL